MWELAAHILDDIVVFMSLGSPYRAISVQKHLLKQLQLTSIQLRRNPMFIGKEDNFEKTHLFQEEYC